MENVTVLKQDETTKSIVDIKDSINHVAAKLAAIRMLFVADEELIFPKDARTGMFFLLDELADELKSLT